MKRPSTLPRLLGLLLLAALITLWARSFRHVDGLALFDNVGHLHGIASDRGTVLLFTSKIPFGHDKAWSAQPFSVAQSEFRQFYPYLYNQGPLKFKRFGIKVCSDSYTLTDNSSGSGPITIAAWPYEGITIPDWLLTAIVTIPTFRSLRGVLVRRRRKARGQCIGCGYDLRGAPACCPECGELPTK